MWLDSHKARIHLSTNHWLIFILLVLSSGVYFWGIRQDLPYDHNGDEEFFVKPAVRIAATGEWNPKWFGHPGATVIYPLAIGYRLGYALCRGGHLFAANPEMTRRLEQHPAKFYWWARVLMAAYAAASLLLVYLIGLRLFDRLAGFLGSLLFLFYPLVVAHAQIVRTDSAGIFFSLLALWLCLRLREKNSPFNQWLVGAAIGCSLATRYFLVALVLVHIAINFQWLWNSRQDKPEFRLALRNAAIGLLAVGLSFFLVSPYWFLDFPTALKDIMNEARPSHLGQDGLSPWGNLIWYLIYAIPQTITWPQLTLAIFGWLVLIIKRDWQAWPVWLFVLLFLVGISLSPLHWERWVIQLLPLIALHAAYGLISLGSILVAYSHWPRWVGVSTSLLLTGAVLFHPLEKVIEYDHLQAQYSTQILAKEWVEANLALGSHIVREWYTGPINPQQYKVKLVTALPQEGSWPLLQQKGYQYAMASSGMYNRYFQAPQRYGPEVNFYRDLFAQGQLLQEIKPQHRRGPTIRIYAIPPAPALSAREKQQQD